MEFISEKKFPSRKKKQDNYFYNKLNIKKYPLIMFKCLKPVFINYKKNNYY